MDNALTRAELLSTLADRANDRIEELTPQFGRFVMSKLADEVKINEQTLRNFLHKKSESISISTIRAIFGGLGMRLKVNTIFEYEISVEE